MNGFESEFIVLFFLRDLEARESEFEGKVCEN